MDRNATLGRSLIQHGKASDRVYLMAVAADESPELLVGLDEFARRHDYGKIFAKVPAGWQEAALGQGYRVEARVPNFFRGSEDGLFLGKFLKPERARCREKAQIEEVLALAGSKAAATEPGEQLVSGHGMPPLALKAAVSPTATGATGGAADGDRQAGEHVGDPAQGVVAVKESSRYRTRLCTPADCLEMAQLFRRVFPSYPFPIHDPDFLAQTMADKVCYAGSWRGDNLAALASAEYAAEEGHAEMTDFATAPEHRRQGLAARLLAVMEEEMHRRGIGLAYTIARAVSAGINISFARAGYHHAGTLINNTQICGRIESMNVWYKSLR